MEIFKQAAAIFMGFSGGLIISGAVFAFITVIGVVPRLAQKTNTIRCVKLYESAIMVGGIIGASTDIIQYRLPIGSILVMLYSVCIGIFFGCVAVSLAEVLDVIPILTRRIRVQRGMFFFILAIAIGKLAGSCLYYIVPGFFKES